MVATSNRKSGIDVATESISPLEKFVTSVHYFNPRMVSIFRLDETKAGERSFDFVGFYNGNEFELTKGENISAKAREDAIRLYNDQFYMGKGNHYRH
ncbi:MAG TPA: hypothetical protein VI564_09245 [Candidatus Nanoarchaeia archaeon]|nr:hypothetical protein [Candidatus Nanoarchaeia archaeon]